MHPAQWDFLSPPELRNTQSRAAEQGLIRLIRLPAAAAAAWFSPLSQLHLDVTSLQQCLHLLAILPACGHWAQLWQNMVLKQLRQVTGASLAQRLAAAAAAGAGADGL
jgi:hypothetical protein